MKVILVSRDNDLYILCRDILEESGTSAWELVRCTSGHCPAEAEADLYIWDGPAKLDLQRDGDGRLSNHLLLIHRNDIAEFHQTLSGRGAAILLKPVTRACLSAFLGVGLASHDRRAAADSLRADRDEILQCLIQANLQLQEYDQDRTNFLARAVHDFRAPLTASGGYCGLLLSEALGPLTDDQREVLSRMQHSIRRLSRMASAMFELSIGRHVKRQPELRSTNIRDCVEQAVHEVTPFADAKNISLTVDLNDDGLTLFLEPGQIEQVLINLLDNACKFTHKGGAIEIRGYPFFWERCTLHQGLTGVREHRQETAPAANSYRIDIRDSGSRIPGEHLGKIFEEYTSYAGGHDRSGGGLGLAICKMIITAHEGRVWAENTENGPRFTFVLPARLSEAGKPEAVQTVVTSEAC